MLDVGIIIVCKIQLMEGKPYVRGPGTLPPPGPTRPTPVRSAALASNPMSYFVPVEKVLDYIEIRITGIAHQHHQNYSQYKDLQMQGNNKHQEMLFRNTDLI